MPPQPGPAVDDRPRPTSSSDAGGPRPRGPRAVPWRGVAWGLVVGSLVLRAWAGAAGWFYWDDFILIGRSGRAPALSAELLLHDHDGHLMPGAYALTAWLTGIAPFDFGAALTVLLVLQLMAACSVLVALRTLAGGHGPAVVAGLALVLVSPLTLPSFVWWAAAVNALPLQIAIAWAIWAGVRLDAGGGRRTVAVGVLALLGGLLFFEKAVLVPFAAAGCVLVLRAYREGPRRAIRSAWGTQRVLWLAWLGILAAHQALYRAVVEGGVDSGGDLGVAAAMVGRGLAGTVVPTLAGGPLHWAALLPGAVLADPPGWLVLGASALLGLTVVLTVRRVPRTGWAWALGLGYVLADLVLLVIGRAAPGVEPAIAQSQRYTADAAVVLAAVLVLVARAEALGAPRRAAPRAGSVPSRRGGWAVAAAGGLVVLGWLWSTWAFVGLWRESPARAYVQTAVDSLGGHVRDPMLDQPVPQEVLFGLATPYNRVAWFFSPIDRRPPVVGSVPALRGLDASGRFGDLTLQVARRGTPDVAFCGTQVGPAALDLRLDGPLLSWDWIVSVPYTTDRATQVDVALGQGSRQRVELRPGAHVVFANVSGGGDVLRVTPVDPGRTVCLGQVEVGLVEVR